MPFFHQGINKVVLVSINVALISILSWTYLSYFKRINEEESHANEKTSEEKDQVQMPLNKLNQSHSSNNIKKEDSKVVINKVSNNYDQIDSSDVKIVKAMSWTRLPPCRCCIQRSNIRNNFQHMGVNTNSSNSLKVSNSGDNSLVCEDETNTSMFPSNMGAITIVDTHNHVHQYAEDTEEDFSTINELKAVKIGVSVVLAVNDDEWDQLLLFGGHGVQENTSLMPTTTSVVIGLGVHPWYVQDAGIGWELRLEELLMKHPSVILGEIGLCKCARNLRGPDGKSRIWPMQQSFFKTQLTIAARLNRPTSVHCVKAYGPMMNILYDLIKEGRKGKEDGAKKQIRNSASSSSSSLYPDPDTADMIQSNTPTVSSTSSLPPVIALHSYGGTAMQVEEIIAFEELIHLPADSCPTFTSWASQRAKQLKVFKRNKINDENSIEKVASKNVNIDEKIDEQKDVVFYFGFSYSINAVMGEARKGEKNHKKLLDIIRTVPDNRLLIESDEIGDCVTDEQVIGADIAVVEPMMFEESRQKRSMLGTMKALVLVAEAKGWDMQHAAKVTSDNAMRFLRQ